MRLPKLAFRALSLLVGSGFGQSRRRRVSGRRASTDESRFEPSRKKPSWFCDVEQIGRGWQVLHVTTAAPILLTVVWIYQCYTQHLADKETEKEGEKGGGGEQRKPVSPTLCSYSRLKKDAVLSFESGRLEANQPKPKPDRPFKSSGSFLSASHPL